MQIKKEKDLFFIGSFLSLLTLLMIGVTNDSVEPITFSLWLFFFICYGKRIESLLPLTLALAWSLFHLVNIKKFTEIELMLFAILIILGMSLVNKLIKNTKLNYKNFGLLFSLIAIGLVNSLLFLFELSREEVIVLPLLNLIITTITLYLLKYNEFWVSLSITFALIAFGKENIYFLLFTAIAFYNYVKWCQFK